jgi:hypothetical protein
MVDAFLTIVVIVMAVVVLFFATALGTYVPTHAHTLCDDVVCLSVSHACVLFVVPGRGRVCRLCL